MTYVDGQNINMAIEINQIFEVSRVKPISVKELYEKEKLGKDIYEDVANHEVVNTDYNLESYYSWSCEKELTPGTYYVVIVYNPDYYSYEGIDYFFILQNKKELFQ